ncbi:MAG: DNA recombination protein RmuC [Gammaproteobacteria bacterium CG11_big_fil_rev_8_21_14_0_20_46_22]|nr:MAG: DNA recombination protein RmuC [Gammaproteobacteria bacterium CG12_big_fil_rev_8_21_14_0_65_46_12]PIR11709.1 MAG: DNA recombination protein RmuC [Gammaproteobacteria bacterium CG11_big_fil_rev_8_21_14_0_20_46_22]
MIVSAVILSALAVLLLMILVFRSFSQSQQTAQAALVREAQFETQEKLLAQVNQLQLALSGQLNDFRAGFDKHQLEGLKTLQESLQTSLKQSREELGLRVEGLTNRTDERLKEISGQVEKRLTQGFEKTTEVFNDVIKRLALIDEAQKKITELSRNVVNLQEILADKRSRGAFGEVQLSNLVRNVMPEENFSLQHTFANGKRADCVLFLPEPSGTIAIDAKFPLESYQSIYNLPAGSADRVQAERQFKRDIQKHIQDIAERYIIKNETADGAVMFIPAESVFAEIYAYHPDLVAQAHKAKVWMVSPTTMMAILTTARAVLKDEATRKQVHIIQDHLARLAKDFKLFQSRMDDVARHIAKAHENVEKVHTSARKITSRFEKIERVEVGEDTPFSLAEQPD